MKNQQPTHHYLILSDDGPLALVATAPWLTDPDCDDCIPENRITKVIKRYKSPIFPIIFTWLEYRQVKTFMGETLEDFMREGFYVEPVLFLVVDYWLQKRTPNGRFLTMRLKDYIANRVGSHKENRPPIESYAA